jgi:hypothetical protein
LSMIHGSRRTTPFDMAEAMPEYALAILHKAIACLYIAAFQRIITLASFPHDSRLR